MLRVILAMVETLYLFLKLYTSARKKRKAFRIPLRTKYQQHHSSDCFSAPAHPGVSAIDSTGAASNSSTDNSNGIADKSASLPPAVEKKQHRSADILKDLLLLVALDENWTGKEDFLRLF